MPETLIDRMFPELSKAFREYVKHREEHFDNLTRLALAARQALEARGSEDWQRARFALSKALDPFNRLLLSIDEQPALDPGEPDAKPDESEAETMVVSCVLLSRLVRATEALRKAGLRCDDLLALEVPQAVAIRETASEAWRALEPFRSLLLDDPQETP